MSFYTIKKRRTSIIKDMLNYYGIPEVIVNSKSFIGSAMYRKKRNTKRIRNKGLPSDLKKLYMENKKSIKRETIYAEYVFDSNTINLNQNELDNDKEFLITVLHEIKHAIDSKDMGHAHFKNSYFNEMDMHESFNNDGYTHNKYEIEAEEFALREYNQWLAKL